MRLWSLLRSWLRATLRRSRMESEMDAELRFHMEAYAEDLMRGGVARHEAMRRARLEFGGIERVKEEGREARGANLIESLVQDLRYGMRMLRKSPGFTSVAVLTLALGIGANTAIFSVIYSVLLRPLPYPDSQRVYQVSFSYRGQLDPHNFSFRDVQFLEQRDAWSQGIAASTPTGLTFSNGSAAERVDALYVTAGYFSVLGVPPFLGRDFQPEEDREPGANVAILNHGLWQRGFALDPSVIGKNILLDSLPYTVVGVMPAGFDSHPSADVYLPIAHVARTAGSGQNLTVIGRLKDGLTPRAAQARIEPLSEPFFRTKNVPENSIGDIRFVLTPFQKMLAFEVSDSLFILLGSVAFVLLIACANIANLLLARGAARTREIALRRALGASRGRLARQLLTESVLLAALAGICGVLLARVLLALLLALAPPALPRITEIGVDRWTLLFALLITAATGILFGLAPVAQSTGPDLNVALKEGPGRGTAGAGRGRLRAALIVSEIAISLILLAGAALLSTTFVNLLHTDPGIDPHRLLSVEIWLTGSRYHSAPELAAYYNRAVEAIDRTPGVESAAVVNAGQPLERGGNLPLIIRGPDQINSVDYRAATPGYFHTLSVRLLGGRDFSDADSETSQRVAIVNASFARRYIENRDPLGELVDLNEDKGRRTVIGITADIKSNPATPAEPTVFIPAAQADFETSQIFDNWIPSHVLVRTSGDPLRLATEVQNQLRSVDPIVPIGRTRSLDQVLAASVALQGFMMVLVGVFAALAVLLAAVGIYGVMTYSVAQRTSEIGVRMALGAGPGHVLWLILRHTIRLVGIGVLVGLAGGLALTRVLANMLYGVRPYDPATFLGVATALVVIALVASYLPARRAMRVDPMVALRYE